MSSLPTPDSQHLPRARANGEEILIELARAPLGARVFLEAVNEAGPPELIPALALPLHPGSDTRFYRAVLSSPAILAETALVPLAVIDGKELRGEPIGGRHTVAPVAQPLEGEHASPIALELFAHVDVELPRATVFGATPEGIRMAFYIKSGRWYGPHVRARYKSEGGDWLLVRKDGIAIPDVRATLETEDGALFYYRVTGTLDLGPDGYARTLANDLPQSVPISVVGQISTSSEQWKWVNRRTFVGAGVVDLKVGRAQYDIFSVTCNPNVFSR
jgi:Protein of unknown function (DUF3237)